MCTKLLWDEYNLKHCHPLSGPIKNLHSYLVYYIALLRTVQEGEGIWLSGKTLDCRHRDSEFDPPSLQLKLLKGVCTGSSQEKCSRVSVLYTGHVKEPGLSCVVGAPVSCTMGH